MSALQLFDHLLPGEGSLTDRGWDLWCGLGIGNKITHVADDDRQLCDG